MRIEYENSNVKELFDDLNNVQNSKNLMKKHIGLEMTKSVKKRYNQMVAFSSFFALLASRIGKMESLSGDKDGDYALHLTANYRLIVAPNTSDRSAESLKFCDTLIIKGVMDYHGKGSKNNWIIP